MRYGEQLAISAASFDGIYERIKGERNAIDRLMCGIFKEKMETIRPEHGGSFSVPFPGTLTSALMLSDTAAKEELRSHTRDGRRICQHRAEKPLGRTNILTS